MCILTYSDEMYASLPAPFHDGLDPRLAFWFHSWNLEMKLGSPTQIMGPKANTLILIKGCVC